MAILPFAPVMPVVKSLIAPFGRHPVRKCNMLVAIDKCRADDRFRAGNDCCIVHVGITADISNFTALDDDTSALKRLVKTENIAAQHQFFARPGLFAGLVARNGEWLFAGFDFGSSAVFDAFTGKTDLAGTTGFELPYLVFVANGEHAALTGRRFWLAGTVDAGACLAHFELSASCFFDFTAFTCQARFVAFALWVVGFVAFGLVFVAYPKRCITSGFAGDAMSGTIDAFYARIALAFGIISFVAFGFGGRILNAFTTVTVQTLGASFAHNLPFDAGEPIALGIADGIIGRITFVFGRIDNGRLIFDAATGFAMKSRLTFFKLLFAILACHPGIARTIGRIPVAALRLLFVVDAYAILAGKRRTAWDAVAAFWLTVVADAYAAFA